MIKLICKNSSGLKAGSYFHKNMSSGIFSRVPNKGPMTQGRWGAWSPTFLRSKKKKGRQRQKRKGFKAETIKRLSPRSKYFCFSRSRPSRKVLLSTNHGGRQYFSVFHAPPSMLHPPPLPSPSLSNPFCQP